MRSAFGFDMAALVDDVKMVCGLYFVISIMDELVCGIESQDLVKFRHDYGQLLNRVQGSR